MRKQEEREARELRQQERRNAQEQKRLEELQVKEQRRAKREARRLERETEKQLRRETQERERQIREDTRNRRRAADRQRREADKQAREDERQRRNEAKEREREIRAQERLAREDARRRERDAERQRRAAERVEERRQREQRNSPNSNAAPRPQRSPTIAGPIAGGGNPPPSSGTRRGSTGASGWTLAPGSEGNSPGAGYDGLILDIRCREAGKTHLECPEYLRAFKGRNAQGFERFGRQHATPAGSGPSSNPSTQAFGGGSAIIGGRSQLGQIGDNSINGGGPSTTILDDIGGFNNEFQSNPVRGVDRNFNSFEVPKEEPKDPNDWVLDLGGTEADE